MDIHFLEYGVLIALCFLLIQNWIATGGIIRFTLNGILALVGLALVVGVFFSDVNQSTTVKSTEYRLYQVPMDASFAQKLAVSLQILKGDTTHTRVDSLSLTDSLSPKESHESSLPVR